MFVPVLCIFSIYVLSNHTLNVCNTQGPCKMNGISICLNPNTAPFVPKMVNYNMSNDVCTPENSLPTTICDANKGYLSNTVKNPSRMRHMNNSEQLGTLNPMAKCYTPLLLTEYVDIIPPTTYPTLEESCSNLKQDLEISPSVSSSTKNDIPFFFY